MSNWIYVLLVVMTCCFASPLVAQDRERSAWYVSDTMQVMLEVNRLINEDREANSAMIRYLSTYLTPGQRKALLASHRESAGGPFVVNLLLGFGLGSYMQGDVSAGMIGTITQGAGLMILFQSGSSEEVVTSIGAGLFVVGKLLDLIQPWTFAGGRNEQLERNLKGISISTSMGNVYLNGSQMITYPRVGFSVGL